MGQITITIMVDAAAAVRSRRSQCGSVAVRLTDDDLATLTDTQRDTLARHFDGDMGPFADGPHWGDPLWHHAPPCDRADLETVRGLLDRRRGVMIEAMARADGAVYQVSVGDPAIVDAATSHARYNEARKLFALVTVRRIDAVLVASNSASIPVDVAAAKLWHRMAVGITARAPSKAGGQ